MTNNLNLEDLKTFNAELVKLNTYLDETQAKLALVYEGLCKIVELSKQVENPYPNPYPYQPPIMPYKWEPGEITCKE